MSLGELIFTLLFVMVVLFIVGRCRQRTLDKEWEEEIRKKLQKEKEEKNG